GGFYEDLEGVSFPYGPNLGGTSTLERTNFEEIRLVTIQTQCDTKFDPKKVHDIEYPYAMHDRHMDSQEHILDFTTIVKGNDLDEDKN
ncbi:hypothetical protein HAX54_008858, partial [Datura stramonium]|nr:hypothetical protein [Datura stramonium]